MNAGAIQVIDWHGERARLSPWQGDREVAYLSPAPGGRSLSVGFVRRCLDELAATGYSRVVTSALSPIEQVGFTGAGFSVAQPLCVLTRDTAELPQPARKPPESAGNGAGRGCAAGRAGLALRKAAQADRERVLALDREAFGSFWRLDAVGLDEALHATPRARFRLATIPRPGGGAAVSPARAQGEAPEPSAGAAGRELLCGYAITGCARRHGFLQRLAVDPSHHRAGVGSALVIDSLRWLRRRRAERVYVNTHPDNEAAIALYESLGFRREQLGLAVLSTDLRS